MADNSQGGGIGINLINIPKSLSEVEHSDTWIVDRLIPSTTTIREAQVNNTTSKAMKVKIYPGAATNTDGKFAIQGDDVTNLITNWTTVTPSVATIAAHSSQKILITIKVPTGAADSEQAGVIWASTVTGITGSFTQVSKIGIRIITPVGNYVSKPSTVPTPSGTATAVPKVPSPSTSFFQSNQDIGFILIALILIIIFLLFIKKQINKLRKRGKKIAASDKGSDGEKIKLTAEQFLYLQNTFRNDPKKDKNNEDDPTRE
jgi:hypothetical protein